MELVFGFKDFSFHAVFILPYLSGGSQQKIQHNASRDLILLISGILNWVTGSPFEPCAERTTRWGGFSVRRIVASCSAWQHHKISLRAELSSRLQFSQEVRT